MGGARRRDGRGRPLLLPDGVASDGAGNLYVADSENNTVRKVVVATARVTTLAGAGRPDIADGTGAAARFNDPAGITSDGADNLYVADTADSTIRKVVVTTGAVTTLAGAGWFGSADGIGAAALFNHPEGVACDGAGNLYVADTGNNTIRKVALASGAVTTIAGAVGQSGGADGTGAAARFSGPTGLTSDGAGNLYVADTANSTIRKIVIATGVVTTIAGRGQRPAARTGPGAAARFSSPVRPRLRQGRQPLRRRHRQQHHPEDRHRDRCRHHARGQGGRDRQRGRDRRRRALHLPIRHYQRRAQPLRRRHRQRHHPEGRRSSDRMSVYTVIGFPGRVGVSTGALPASGSAPYGLVLLPTGELAITDFAGNAVTDGHL